MAKKKAGIIRIPCDGLATQEGGWVEMSSYLRTKHLPYVQALSRKDFDVTWEELSISERGNLVLSLRYAFLAVYVYNWNWKNIDGKAYPKPADNGAVFGDLRAVEFNWLWEKVWETIGEATSIPKVNDTPS